jgi:hypothetical protein
MRNFKIGVVALLGLFAISCSSPQKHENKVLVNHVGYHEQGEKKVVFQTTGEEKPKTFNVVDEKGNTVFEGKFLDGGKVDNWHTGNAFAGYFTDFKLAGNFSIVVNYEGSETTSSTFTIKCGQFVDKAMPLMLKGLKSIHPAEKYEKWDSECPFHGDRNEKRDVHGGWYDASGDFSKYFSHLCYTNYMAPQQTPMVAYNLLASANNIKESHAELAQEMIAEATWGADFMVRMQDAAGYFYTIVFDTWSKDETKREICVYETQHGTRTTEYQAAFREGAGIAIAALAKLSAENISGEYSAKEYLATAEKGFAHLLENNTKYCDDNKENIIDDYCALMAATELYNATQKEAYLEHARLRATNLNKRIMEDGKYKGWFRADENGARPYFHAAEAGYPLVALSRYLDVENNEENRNATIATIQKSVAFQLAINNEVHNPFGYPRQYVKGLNEEKRGAFFIPHVNESGYWYQGENARLGSLAAGFNLTKKYMTEDQQKEVHTFVQNQINWILGLNPYDMCLLDGLGRNNPEYLEPHDWNYVGGIANGITAGVNDESDIAFLPSPQGNDPEQRWRWPEQWIPHAGWFMLAITSQK